ncbi:Uncharacterised protein [Burkholderia pseudomallei]|nr:Uncharacterised protein [Burkholderia pseudomallei]CAJ5880551.1 Uncharacterised protein [Burkholderia pseudomallei]
MSLKSDAVELGLAIGAAALVLWWLSRKGNAAAAVNSIDGAATGAVLAIPGASLLTDPATGNIDPAAAGNAAGLAAHDWIAQQLDSAGTSISDWWHGITGAGTVNGIDMGSGAAWSDPTPGNGAAPTAFGDYVSL